MQANRYRLIQWHNLFKEGLREFCAKVDSILRVSGENAADAAGVTLTGVTERPHANFLRKLEQTALYAHATVKDVGDAVAALKEGSALLERKFHERSAQGGGNDDDDAFFKTLELEKK